MKNEGQRTKHPSTNHRFELVDVDVAAAEDERHGLAGEPLFDLKKRRHRHPGRSFDDQAVLFEDPCGTRLEANYVPGKGNLDAAVDLPLPTRMQRLLSEP